MFSNLIEKAEVHFKALKPFVMYRKPLEHSVTAIFQNDDSLNFVSDFTEQGFVFAPFDSNDKIVLLKIDEKVSSIFQNEKKTEKVGEWGNEIDDSQKEFYINLVKKALKSIEKKTFKKVVLSRKLEITTQKSPFTLYKALLSNYNAAFCYLWYHPKVGLWLGATPEILLRTENKQLKTMSLAGTQKYTGIDIPKWGNKELEEQELVTQYISDALIGEVDQLKISETTSVRAGNLFHLRTSVSGLMKNNNINPIVKALHPTPAVCGLPKKTTKEFILKNENYNRAYYTGFLGELNFKEETSRSGNQRNKENQVYKTIKNTTSLYVNLRCMQLEDTKAYIYVGGGITQDSDPNKEWEETVAKSNTMLSVLV